jgi:curved DNA-binding protein CbpA
MTSADPFSVLGLPAGPNLTDEQVRSAWRAIAAASHPDRADGGNPARYAAASAAYAALRTPWGRSEAYADLTSTLAPRKVPAARLAPARPGSAALRSLALVPARLRHGRPLRLIVRVLAATVVALIVVASRAGSPATAAVVAGIGLWLIFTARGDLAPPPGR